MHLEYMRVYATLELISKLLQCDVIIIKAVAHCAIEPSFQLLYVIIHDTSICSVGL